jgi:hypothetical protein
VNCYLLNTFLFKTVYAYIVGYTILYCPFNWKEGEVLVCNLTFKKYKMKIIFVSYLQIVIENVSHLLLLL